MNTYTTDDVNAKIQRQFDGGRNLIVGLALLTLGTTVAFYHPEARGEREQARCRNYVADRLDSSSEQDRDLVARVCMDPCVREGTYSEIKRTADVSLKDLYNTLQVRCGYR